MNTSLLIQREFKMADYTPVLFSALPLTRFLAVWLCVAHPLKHLNHCILNYFGHIQKATKK